jgi:hypothetical protein
VAGEVATSTVTANTNRNSLFIRKTALSALRKNVLRIAGSHLAAQASMERAIAWA